MTALKNFEIFPQNDNSVIELQRVIIGQLTPVRMQAIKNFCSKNTFRSSCLCDYDCCGCLYLQQMKYITTPSGCIVYLTRFFNV